MMKIKVDINPKKRDLESESLAKLEVEFPLMEELRKRQKLIKLESFSNKKVHLK